MYKYNMNLESKIAKSYLSCGNIQSAQNHFFLLSGGKKETSEFIDKIFAT